MDFSSGSYQRRAQGAQGVIRIIIVIALFADLLIFPPNAHPRATFLITVSYAVWSVVLLLANSLERFKPGMLWFAIFVDLVVLTTLLAISGGFSDPLWASPLVYDAFILVPILAAFQYLPKVTLAATVGSAVAFVVGIGIGHSENDPYWESTLLHSLFILVIGAACVFLSWIQQAKLQSITQLAEARSVLVARLMTAEERERGTLAEKLHDGALQSVLAARQDLEELPHEPAVADILKRARRALTDAVNELRRSVSTLHPAVLEHSDLVPALRNLVAETAERAGFAATFDVQTETARTADDLLYRTAREFLVNVAKHARAREVTVRLREDDTMVHLEVIDDGVGVPQRDLRKSVTEGHIGLASHRIRIEDAGGRLEIRSNSPTGTVAAVSLPI